MVPRLEISSPLQLADFLEGIAETVMKFLEILFVKEQLVLAVGHFTRSMVLTLALRDGEVKVLRSRGSNVEKIGALASLHRNGMDVFLSSVVLSPILIAIAAHVSNLLEQKLRQSDADSIETAESGLCR